MNAVLQKNLKHTFKIFQNIFFFRGKSSAEIFNFDLWVVDIVHLDAKILPLGGHIVYLNILNVHFFFRRKLKMKDSKIAFQILICS